MSGSVEGESPHPSLLVMGIGNSLKGDDGVGPYVAELLAGKKAETVGVFSPEDEVNSIDCGTVPENYTGIVRRLRPNHLVLVDAADMGLDVGAMRAIPPEMIGALGLSTHSMPLSMFMSYVADLVGRLTLVGIQPQSMHLGDEMCDSVRRTGEELARTLRGGNAGEIPSLGEDATRP
ncbi:hydrogenase maturation peptidase HycI [Chloroflexota bacterium]